jgi:4-hydroxybenzoate polyprenyltransferase
LLRSLAQFIRASVLGVTYSVVALGLAVPGRLTALTLLGLGLTGLLFHSSVYVLNDVVDLEVDRTTAARQDFPQPRGAVSRPVATATALVLGTLGLGVSYAWWRQWTVATAYSVAMLCLWAYDLLGKRLWPPMLSDLLQGLGWGFVCVMASASVAQWHYASLPVFAYVVVLILLVNGVHGSVRDYENDTAHHLRTTAVFFLGQRQPRPHRLPAPYLAYALALQCAQVGLALLADRTAHGHAVDVSVALALCVAVEFVGTACLAGAAMHLAEPQVSEGLAGWHIVFSLLGGVTVLLASGRVVLFLVLLVILIGVWASAKRVRTQTATAVVSLAHFADWRPLRR